MRSSSPVRIADPDACVETVLTRVGRRLVLGLPVGIGKPNLLANAFVRRAAADPSIRLTIVTALSLKTPRWSSDLERRYFEPLARRVFGDYPELEYVRMLEERRLPANIEVIEFYFEPGAWLGNDAMQQHYLSSNYTHVLRDAIGRGLNVLLQLVVPPPPREAVAGMLSLGSNSDLTVDLLPHLDALRAAGRPFALVGQYHRELPFMYGDALVPASCFDYLVDEPALSFPLFAPPNLPIGLTEHAIALNVSALVRDGGTLQLGIGELGDAITSAILLRHRSNSLYCDALATSGLLERSSALIRQEGGTAPFERGLYACSEMLVDGFVDLYRAGVLKRCVLPNARLQRLLDDGAIGESVGSATLEALAATGIDWLSPLEFAQLRAAGVFRDDVRLAQGELIAPDGSRVPARLGSANERDGLAPYLGDRLRGVLADAGFFLGPRSFYSQLREMPVEERRRFAMRGITWVNDHGGPGAKLKAAQRRHARFVNTTMMVTGLGAAVSDGLADGRVVSGVGGQYNFVAMAHALPEARSILCLRSTRQAQGGLTSNIVWSYGHATIPRHLRDIVVTEYGIADLRGRTDREIVSALVEVMDARFQESFVLDAMRAGKLPPGYRIPDAARENRSETLRARFAVAREQGAFPELPFGSDLTAEEIELARALKWLKTALSSWRGRIGLARRLVAAAPSAAALRPGLARMALADADGLPERFKRRLVAAALEKTGSEQFRNSGSVPSHRPIG
jgi:acyl-CoA hydrolase